MLTEAGWPMHKLETHDKTYSSDFLKKVCDERRQYDLYAWLYQLSYNLMQRIKQQWLNRTGFVESKSFTIRNLQSINRTDFFNQSETCFTTDPKPHSLNQTTLSDWYNEKKIQFQKLINKRQLTNQWPKLNY